MKILKTNGRLSRRVLHRFGTDDALRVSGHRIKIEHCTFVSTLKLKKPHWDANQYVAPSPHGWVNRQYAGGSINGAITRFCHYFALGTLQPIAGFDGRFDNIVVADCMIHTDSAHKIVFNGLQSGVFTNNYLADGTPANVVLDSTRLGGGENGGLYVLSMKGAKYKKIKTSDPEYLIDTRGEMVDANLKRGARYVADLDVTLFEYRASLIKYPTPKDPKKAVHIWCNALQNLALEMGTLVE